MGGFSELIKSFDKTRDYVRDFFIYGFKVRNDFERKSLRTYDDEKRRVESWLGDYLRYDTTERGKQVAISVDSGQVSENPLYNAYYSKSFTDNDIRLHFKLTDILSEGESLCLKELTERLDERFGELFEVQTVRNKLKEYVNEGIFICEKRGKTDYFSLSPDNTDTLLSSFRGLDDAVKFFSADQPYGIIGDSLLKTAELKNDLFLIKHNYIVHTLEDVILPELTRAIEEKRYISFRTFSAKNKLNGGELKEAVKCVPLQIFSSVQTGRRYLAAYVVKYKRFNAFRLDFIRSVSMGECCDDFDVLSEKFTQNLSHCFGVSFGTRRELGNVGKVKLVIELDEENEHFILDRLNREKRMGSLEKIDNGVYTLTVDAFDPNEVMHWAKTFIGRIRYADAGNEQITKMFYSDVKQLYDMYREG